MSFPRDVPPPQARDSCTSFPRPFSKSLSRASPSPQSAAPQLAYPLQYTTPVPRPLPSVHPVPLCPPHLGSSLLCLACTLILSKETKLRALYSFLLTQQKPMPRLLNRKIPNRIPRHQLNLLTWHPSWSRAPLEKQSLLGLLSGPHTVADLDPSRSQLPEEMNTKDFPKDNAESHP